MTILRSIDFSRATASAICNSSSLFALIPACAMLSSLHSTIQISPQRPRPPPGPWLLPFLARRNVSRMSSSVSTRRASATSRDRQADDLAAQLIELDLDANLLAFDALEHAAEPLAARDQLLHLDLGLVARPVLEIGRPHQRPVDAGRGHLERVLPLHGVVRVEHRRKAARDLRALLHRDRALRPLGHDLHGRPVASRHDHPHQAEAQIREHRLGDGRDLGGQAGLANEARVGRSPAHRPQSRQVQVFASREARADRPKQKERTPRAHSQS